jgi:hypothetical protein
MSLTGQLNDLSLGELIEFFCNQRKTGRLKVDYALAPGVFFIDGGELVDAKVGALNGAEAVYFAMTLPSASFDFSAGMRSSRRTISERWPSVVLEGLRRIDEGLPPTSEDAFRGDLSLDGATLDYLDCVGEQKAKHAAEAASVAGEIDAAFEQTAHPARAERHAGDAPADTTKDVKKGAAGGAPKDAPKDAAKAAAKDATGDAADAAAPFSMTVEAATSPGGGRRRAAFAAVAAVLIICAVAAVPLGKRLMRKDAPPPAAAETAPAAAESTQPAEPSTDVPADASDVRPTPDFTAEEAARREREAREREARERARRQRQEAARRAEEGAGDNSALAPAAPKPASSGPKSVRVQIAYDEAGRVTQAAAVGTSPGAEAYASTAVRIARGRRFPAGKAGTTVVTIPIN